MQPARFGAWGVGDGVRALLLVAVAACIASCEKSGNISVPTRAAATYVGSDACVSCHQDENSDWLGSHHQLAMQPATAQTVLGDFAAAEFEYYGEKSRFLTDADGFYIETTGSSGALEEFRIANVFGVAPLQQYLVEIPGGRMQALPFAWDTRESEDGGQRWFHLYPDEYAAPGSDFHWTGRQHNWNFMCAECHSTNLKMGYDVASDTYSTSYSEISVGCEACHGPGSTHILQAEAGGFRSRFGLEVSLDDQGRSAWIMNLETGIAQRSELALRAPQQPETCGRCHSRRSIISEDYEPGEPLLNTHIPSLLDAGLYYPDGQILDEVYVYGSFLQSRMYQAGVTCSDCHNPHSLDLKTGPDPNAVCSQCHLDSRFAAATHHGHVVSPPGCVDCHMPATTYMVNDPRRDHSFRVPRPDLTPTTGSPNACMNCHSEQTSGWAAAAVKQWHGAGTNERAEFANAIAAARRGFANDELRNEMFDAANPGMARATALSLLAPPFTEDDYRAIQDGLGDPDPLLRLAALRVHGNTPAEFRLQFGTDLLDDRIRGVRLEAARTFADIRDYLPQGARSHYEAANRELVHSFEISADRPESHAGLGGIAASNGNLDGAASHYQRAISMAPEFGLARINLSDVYRRLGDEEAGATVLREGLRLVPDDATLRHSYGLLLVRLQRHDEGLVELQEAVRLAPDNARFGYVLAVAYYSLEQRDAAVELIQRLAQQHPNNPDIQGLLQSLSAN